MCWWSVSLPWQSRKPRRRSGPADGAGTGWTETGPAIFLDPGGREPRSAAERLLALETKFLLFWVGQERDSVLSRSPAPRSDCSSSLRERNLPVAALWPSPKSGTHGGRRFRALKGGGDQGWRTAWSVRSMERSNQAGGRHGPLDRWKGQTQAGGGHRPLDRWKGIRKPAPWLWLVVGRSDPSRVPRIQGTASGQQDD